jgi:hypothetical protein
MLWVSQISPIITLATKFFYGNVWTPHCSFHWNILRDLKLSWFRQDLTFETLQILDSSTLKERIQFKLKRHKTSFVIKHILHSCKECVWVVPCIDFIPNLFPLSCLNLCQEWKARVVTIGFLLYIMYIILRLYVAISFHVYLMYIIIHVHVTKILGI